MSTSFLEPILRNLFREKRDLPRFFSSRVSCPVVRLSWDRDIVRLETGSGPWTVLVGSGTSDTAFRNFGLQEDARSRFSFSLTTGESDFRFAPGFLAKRDELGRSSSGDVSTGGGLGAILLLFGERIDSPARLDCVSAASSSASAASHGSGEPSVGSFLGKLTGGGGGFVL